MYRLASDGEDIESTSAHLVRLDVARLVALICVLFNTSHAILGDHRLEVPFTSTSTVRPHMTTDVVVNCRNWQG